MTWNAVYTGPRMEWTAHWMLRQQGFQTLYLHFIDTVTHARKTREKRRPYLPRYLFVQNAPAYSVNHTIGVSGLVENGQGPAVIPDDVIQELASRGDSQGLVTLEPEQKAERKRFINGDTVRIAEGPFQGLLGMVSLDSGQAIDVWLGKQRIRGFRPHQVSPASAEHTQ